MGCERIFTVPRLTGVIRFEDADAVLAALRSVLAGWSWQASAASTQRDRTVLSVSGKAGQWTVSAVTLERPVVFDDPVSAACSVIANALQAQMLEERRFLCLHAAAVEIGGALVLMPCRYRAGKSLLTAALAAAGCRVFNDDVILIDPDTDEAVAPGIAVRLRHPLPDTVDRDIRDFLERHAGARGSRYLYLDLPDRGLARHGDRGRIHGFVLLNRQPEGPASLARIAPGHLLRHAVWQNFARAGEAERILDTLARHVESARCLQLTYSDLSEARDLIMAHFQSPRQVEPAGPIDAVCEEDALTSLHAARLPAGARVARKETARLTVRAGECFLTTSGGILHLNELAKSLWILLATPRRYEEIVETFQAAFPGTPADMLDRDLRHALAAFEAHDLLEIGRLQLRSQNAPL